MVVIDTVLLESTKKGTKNLSAWTLPVFSWDQKPGKAKDIAVGDSNIPYIIGYGSGNRPIFRWNGSGWTQLPSGAGTRIAVDGDTPWIVNTSGHIFKYNSSSQSWSQKPGLARDITARDGEIYIISKAAGNGQVYRWTGSQWSLLNPVGAGLKLDVGVDGSLYLVTLNSQLYRYTSSGWLYSGAGYQNIGIFDVQSFYLVENGGSNGDVIEYNPFVNPGGSGPVLFDTNGRGIEIAVDENNYPWIVNNVGNIYRAIR